MLGNMCVNFVCMSIYYVYSKVSSKHIAHQFSTPAVLHTVTIGVLLCV